MSGSRVCAHCGALNGQDFDRCIRCGLRLSGLGAASALLGAHLDPRRLWTTRLILVLTVGVFAGQLYVGYAHGGRPSGEALLGGGVLGALRMGALIPSRAEVLHQPFRLLSAVFVHFGLLHIGLNLLAFWNLARVAEPILGSARFLIAYVVTGVFGFATTVAYGVVMGEAMGPTAGASGAIMGMMGLILGWLLRRRDPRWKQLAVQAVFYGVVFGFMVNRSNLGVQVNNSAHVGGLVCGTVLGLLFQGEPATGGPAARPGGDVLVNLAAALCLAASVAAVGLSVLFPPWSFEQELSREEAPPRTVLSGVP